MNKFDGAKDTQPELPIAAYPSETMALCSNSASAMASMIKMK
jgi:hypothetical protein